jgi:hypothetical protein
MDLNLESAIAFINASLAPAVLFTGVGLLLAGLQAKYSTIVSVIRVLNRERRELEAAAGAGAPQRLATLGEQIHSLMRRAKLVRNSVCSFYLTIFFLVGSSILIGLRVLGIGVPIVIVFVFFGAALAVLFAGIAFATREALLSYHIVQAEVKQWTR